MADAEKKERPAQNKSRLRTFRRATQLFFLLVFLWLFFSARDPYQPVIPADSFLQISPLLAISTFFTAHRITWYALGAALLLLLSVAFGRFFCGWICPLGTIIDGSDRAFNIKRRKKSLDIPHVFFSIKYVLLIVILAAGLASLQWAGVFDPIALLTRTMTVVVFPLIALLLFSMFKLLFTLGIAEDRLGALYYYAQKSLLPLEPSLFLHGLLIALIFCAILALGIFSRRFWCRYACPLGALFGLFARLRFFYKTVDDRCTECGVCIRTCRMNAVVTGTWQSNPAECIECAECLANCPPGALSYKMGRGKVHGAVDLSRRRVLLAACSGLVGTGLLKTTRTIAEPVFLRPPGALDESGFLRSCIRCMACAKICESTGGCLQPALFESGIEGLWTPMVVPRMGYCEYSCAVCGQVCPSGAIAKLPLAEKQQVKIGRAVFNKNTCIPWSQHNECLVCEEHCPLPQKAIRFDSRQVESGGSFKMVKLPFVDEELCIGCGICENKCPVVATPGIVVIPVHKSGHV